MYMSCIRICDDEEVADFKVCAYTNVQSLFLSSGA